MTAVFKHARKYKEVSILYIQTCVVLCVVAVQISSFFLKKKSRICFIWIRQSTKKLSQKSSFKFWNKILIFDSIIQKRQNVNLVFCFVHLVFRLSNIRKNALSLILKFSKILKIIQLVIISRFYLKDV